MTALRVLIFLTSSAAILVGAHVYLYRRWVRDITERSSLRAAGKWLLALLGASAALGRPILYLAGSAATRPMAIGILTWLGFALAGFFVLLTVEAVVIAVSLIVRLPRRPRLNPDPLEAGVDRSRRQFLARAMAGGSVLVAGVGSGVGLRSALGPPQVSEVPIRLPRLPTALSGLTLVQLSDLHIGEISQERFVRDVVERCNGLRPDAVVITGDLVDGSVARLGRYVAKLQGLQSRYGTFFVTGNHDYYSGANEWCAALSGLGITVLRNRAVQLGDAGASLDLVGVDDWGSRRSANGYDLDAAVSGLRSERASVLLAHQPGNFEETATRGLGLQLSGHTHGGQVFPLTRLIGVAWPYHTGLYSRGDSSIYVSRGTGFVGPPMRIDSPPEIVRITLTT